MQNESSLLSARRCDLGVGGANMSKSTTRSISNHMEHVGVLLSNSDHDAMKAERPRVGREAATR